ncbi:MAG: ATP synthase subunit C [Phycisphaerae bacterium]|nr:ATP synthase subunit C [Phycisphaerae bacterium]
MKSLGVVVVLVLLGVLAGGSRAAETAAETQPAAEAPPTAETVVLTGDQMVQKTAALAASVAFVMAVSIVGAAYAVGRIGSAALGAAAEKPELLARSLAFVGLAEGLALTGFVIAILLWIKM